MDNIDDGAISLLLLSVFYWNNGDGLPCHAGWYKAGSTVVGHQIESVAWQDLSDMMIWPTDIDVMNSRLLGHLQH